MPILLISFHRPASATPRPSHNYNPSSFVRISYAKRVQKVCTIDEVLMRISRGLKFVSTAAAHVSKLYVGLLCDNSVSSGMGGVK
jgi:hypothetical protein